jgi:hypothetical protein
MSVFWWILLAYLAWAAAGIARAISLLGNKYHKETILDKILLTGAMPIAYVIGYIVRFCKYLAWVFGKSPITQFRERTDKEK